MNFDFEISRVDCIFLACLFTKVKIALSSILASAANLVEFCMLKVLLT